MINVSHTFLSFSGTDFVHSIVNSICCHLQVVGISTSVRANSRKHSHLSTAAVDLTLTWLRSQFPSFFLVLDIFHLQPLVNRFLLLIFPGPFVHYKFVTDSKCCCAQTTRLPGYNWLGMGRAIPTSLGLWARAEFIYGLYK